MHKLDGVKPILSHTRQQFKPKGTPLGIQYWANLKQMPDYDFEVNKGRWQRYEERIRITTIVENEKTGERKIYRRTVTEPNPAPGSDVNILLETDKAVLRFRKIRLQFYRKIDTAKQLERKRNYAEAVKLYEWCVGQHCTDVFPYQRLIIIYAKAGLKQAEKEVLLYAIAFFKDQRTKQAEYAFSLATKYGLPDAALDAYNDKKAVRYFEYPIKIFDPYPIIESWEKRLKKYF